MLSFFKSALLHFRSGCCIFYWASVLNRSCYFSDSDYNGKCKSTIKLWCITTDSGTSQCIKWLKWAPLQPAAPLVMLVLVHQRIWSYDIWFSNVQFSIMCTFIVSISSILMLVLVCLYRTFTCSREFLNCDIATFFLRTKSEYFYFHW